MIYDLLAFCPWCGPDRTPPHAVFVDNLAAQERLLALVDEFPDEARVSIEAAGGVTALTERALTGLVAATQNLAKRVHAKPGSHFRRASRGRTSIGCRSSGLRTSAGTRWTGWRRPP